MPDKTCDRCNRIPLLPHMMLSYRTSDGAKDLCFTCIADLGRSVLDAVAWEDIQ